MSPLLPSYPTRVDPEYPNIPEAKRKDIKTNHIKIVKILKEEMSKSLLKSQDTNNHRK